MEQLARYEALVAAADLNRSEASWAQDKAAILTEVGLGKMDVYSVKLGFRLGLGSHWFMVGGL